MTHLYENVEMTKVQSSNIKSVGYVDGDLLIQYNTGLYLYKSVPKPLYEELLKADSKGRFVNEKIKHIYNYDYIR